jgi:hypothetical protein
MLNGKTVLIIGEDSLMIYGSSGGKSQRLGILNWDEENLTDRLVGFLLREGRKNPVYILYDMLEQQYKKETVPKLSPLDKRAYISRKLKVVFPSNPMRAAYFLKGEAEENLLKGKGKEEGTPYIFASIPNVMQFDIIYDAIKKSELQLLNIGFLPVEATGLMSKLASSKLTGGIKAKWNVLLSVHESGGLRQIITKNGELALTRLTAISSDNIEPSAWGREAGVEFKSTLSYLLRFGYSQDQSMNIFIVNDSSEVKEAFASQLDINPGIFVGSANQLGQNIGLKVQGHSGENFGDGLHAAWLSKVRSMKLPVSSGRFLQVQNTRKYFSYGIKALALFFVLGIGFSIFKTQQISSVKSNTASELQKHANLQTELSQSERAIPTIAEGVEYEEIISLLNVYDKLESNGIKSLAMVHAIANTMPNNLRLKGLKIEAFKKLAGLGDEEANIDFIDPDMSSESEEFSEETDILEQFTEQQVNVPYEITLNISFPPYVGLEDAVSAVKLYHKNLSELLVGYEVSIKQQAANLSSSTDFTEDLTAKISNIDSMEELDTEDNIGNDGMQKQYDAIIIIKGEGQ